MAVQGITSGGQDPVAALVAALQATNGAVTPRGAWAGPGTVYAVRDVVSQGGQVWSCIVAHTSSAAFATDAANWAAMSPTPATLAARTEFATTYAQVVALTGTGIDTTGAVDSSAAVQALATANPGAILRAVPGATYRMANQLVLSTGHTLDLTGSTWNWVGWANELIINKAAITPARSVADAAITAASTTLTSSSAAFTAADVGRSVTVAGAGPSTFNLAAIITAVTNGTTVTLDTAATGTVSGAALSIYTRDTDISIIGGTITRDTTVSNTHSIMFRRADRVKIRPQSVVANHGKYAINLGHVRDFEVSGIYIDAASDGVHIDGPCARGTIERITGTSGDDFIALTGNEYSQYANVVGDIRDLSIRDIHRSLPTHGVGNTVRVLSGQQCKIRNVTIDSVTGYSLSHMVAIADDGGQPSTVGQDTDGLFISNVTGTPGGGYACVALGGTGLTGVNVTGVNIEPGASAACLAISLIGATGGTLVLTARGITSMSGTTATLISIVGSATWRLLNLSDLTLVAKADKSAGRVISIAAASGIINADNVTMVGGSSLIYINPAAGTVPLNLRNVQTPTASNIGVNVASACTATGVIDGWAGVLPDFGCFGLTVAGASCDYQVTNSQMSDFFYRSLTQTGRIVGWGFKSRVDRITGAQAGDIVHNVNGALSCGTGPVLYNGTTWKHLYTGATY